MVSLGSFREQRLGTALSGLIPEQIREYRPGAIFLACAFILVFSVLLGGGTRGGFLSDAVLELFAIPALLIALVSMVDSPVWKTKSRTDAHWILAFCFALALVPLIQLVPLPPFVWTRLPGREAVANVFNLLGATPWMPISILPHATWISFLSLLPPMAIFLTAIQLGYRERRGLSLVVIAVGVISVFVGLTQVAEGPTSVLRFFTVTNRSEAVGFFANRNHFAALLYVVLIFTAVWAIDVGFKAGSWTEARNFDTTTIIALTATFLIIIVLIAGEAMARSRAGLALTIAALVAIFALAFMDRRNESGVNPSKLLLVVVVLAVMLSVQFALYRFLDRFAIDSLEGARPVIARNTIQAAIAFLPFGSGLGTFVPVYQLFESPGDTIANTYVNHAHDDYLELWLETGLMGPVLIGLFAVWAGRAGVRLWRQHLAEIGAVDAALARAAAVAVALLMVHAFVDYALRTEAIMAVFAVSCAFLVEPLRDSEGGPAAVGAPSRKPARRRDERSLAIAFDSSGALVAPPKAVEEETASSLPPNGPAIGGRWGEDIEWPKAPAAETESPPSPAPSRSSAGARWGDDIEWPEEWRNPGGQKRVAAGVPEPETNSARAVAANASAATDASAGAATDANAPPSQAASPPDVVAVAAPDAPSGENARAGAAVEANADGAIATNDAAVTDAVPEDTAAAGADAVDDSAAGADMAAVDAPPGAPDASVQSPEPVQDAGTIQPDAAPESGGAEVTAMAEAEPPATAIAPESEKPAAQEWELPDDSDWPPYRE